MSKTAKKENQDKAPNQQPMFYQNPVPLLFDRHANAGLSEDISYEFAKDTNSVPINVAEFVEASKTYPIAFTADDVALPVAIVGLEDKKNLFLSKGEWVKNVYIPAYVRRYPFAFTNFAENPENFVLCVDEASPRYSAKAKKNDAKFFEGKEQTNLTKNALAFCAQYHNDFMLTQSFSKTLLNSGLLVDRQVNVTAAGGKVVTLGGFRTVDENKFLNLDDKTIVEWHKNGILGLINLHLMSATNWARLSGILAKNSAS